MATVVKQQSTGILHEERHQNASLSSMDGPTTIINSEITTVMFAMIKQVLKKLTRQGTTITKQTLCPEQGGRQWDKQLHEKAAHLVAVASAVVFAQCNQQT